MNNILIIVLGSLLLLGACASIPTDDDTLGGTTGAGFSKYFPGPQNY